MLIEADAMEMPLKGKLRSENAHPVFFPTGDQRGNFSDPPTPIADLEDPSAISPINRQRLGWTHWGRFPESGAIAIDQCRVILEIGNCGSLKSSALMPQVY
jgi:hypothetical protein